MPRPSAPAVLPLVSLALLLGLLLASPRPGPAQPPATSAGAARTSAPERAPAAAPEAASEQAPCRPALPSDPPRRAALVRLAADEPGADVPREVVVRFDARGRLPVEDLFEVVDVELWPIEPRHLLDPSREWLDDPEPLEGEAERIEGGVRITDVPGEGRMWVGLESWYGLDGLEAVEAVYASVPAAGELTLPVRCAPWVEGRVAGALEDGWELWCRETGEGDEGQEGEAFQLWPVPPGPLQLTVSSREEGRARRRRIEACAPAAGPLALGTLELRGGADVLSIQVRAAGAGVGATVALVSREGSELLCATDDHGALRVEGELADLVEARVTPWDLHGLEPRRVELRGERRLEVELARRRASLVDLVVSPVDARGERVEGELAVVIGDGGDAAARCGPNHSGYCGGGIFWLRLAPPGEQSCAAWIPSRGLSSSGTVDVAPVAPDEPDGPGVFNGRRIVRPRLEPARTLLTGELAFAGDDRRSPYMRAVRPRVTLHGDERSAMLLDWLEPGRFALEGLPAKIDFRIELLDRRERVLARLDLRLDRGEARELGLVELGQPRASR